MIAAVVIAGVTAAHARPPRHKVIVLPIDGSADPATRAKLTASVQRLARVIDGQVSAGDTTFAETAAAVGCDPRLPACADDVRATLGVDELVYGSATADHNQVTLVVRRAARGAPARHVTVTLDAKDPPERAEVVLLPLFTAATTTPPRERPASESEPDPDAAVAPALTGDPSSSPPPLPGAPRTDTPAGRRDRNLGIAAVGGGGTLLLIGLTLWSNTSSIQRQIDDHPTDSFEDIAQLRALEDRAATRALIGNAMVLAGLGLGGLGGYLLWRDRKARMTLAPAVIGGAGIAVLAGGRW